MPECHAALSGIWAYCYPSRLDLVAFSVECVEWVLTERREGTQWASTQLKSHIVCIFTAKPEKQFEHQVARTVHRLQQSVCWTHIHTPLTGLKQQTQQQKHHQHSRVTQSANQEQVWSVHHHAPPPFYIIKQPSEAQLMTTPNISVTPKMTPTLGNRIFNVDFVPWPVCWQMTLFFRRFYLPVSFSSHDDASVIKLVNNRKITNQIFSIFMMIRIFY